MNIGALLKFSSLDYPGKLSCVIFCQGCPLRCLYCHNPVFQTLAKETNVQFSEIISFLKTRQALLDAVVFSGGEPLLQPDLKEKMLEVKSLGFLVGLHTSGVIPEKFSQILSIVDWIGFDIKTSFENYEKATKISNSGNLAKQSFEMLSKHNNFEIRTTFDPRLISEQDLYKIAYILEKSNIKSWVIQECILRNKSVPQRLSLPSKSLIKELSQFVNIIIRRQ